jgi:ribonuclease J
VWLCSCGEIGMNMTLYGFNNEFIMVDAGMMIADRFEIPGVNIIVPDVSCVAPLVKDGRLKALIITHAHEDHTGGIEHVWPQMRIPIYATKFAANLVRFKIYENTGYDIDWKIIKPSPTVDTDFKIGPFDVSMFPVTHSMPECYALVLRTPGGTIYHTGDWKFDADPQVRASPLSIAPRV